MGETISFALKDRYQEILERLKSRFSGTRQMATVLVSTILGVVIVGIMVGSAVIDHDVVSNGRGGGSVRQVRSYLYEKYPGADELNVMKWGRVERSDNSRYKYSVRCKYSVSNQYGGSVVHDQIFSLDKDGQIVEVVGY